MSFRVNIKYLTNCGQAAEIDRIENNEMCGVIYKKCEPTDLLKVETFVSWNLFGICLKSSQYNLKEDLYHESPKYIWAETNASISNMSGISSIFLGGLYGFPQPQQQAQLNPTPQQLAGQAQSQQATQWNVYKFTVIPKPAPKLSFFGKIKKFFNRAKKQ